MDINDFKKKLIPLAKTHKFYYDQDDFYDIPYEINEDPDGISPIFDEVGGPEFIRVEDININDLRVYKEVKI